MYVTTVVTCLYLAKCEIKSLAIASMNRPVVLIASGSGNNFLVLKHKWLRYTIGISVKSMDLARETGARLLGLVLRRITVS